MRYTKDQINSWVSEFKQSSQSIKDFSKDKPFHSSTLAYWVRQSQSNVPFIEIKPFAAPFKSPVEIRRPDGLVISINRELSVIEISQLLQC
jgi:hypothetical protein